MEGRACCPSKWIGRPFFGNSRFETGHSVHKTERRKRCPPGLGGEQKAPSRSRSTCQTRHLVYHRVTRIVIFESHRQNKLQKGKGGPVLCWLSSIRTQTGTTAPVAHCGRSLHIISATLDETDQMFEATEFRADWQISDRANRNKSWQSIRTYKYRTDLCPPV